MTQTSQNQPLGDAAPVRVVLANLPGVINDLVASLIEQQPDMTLAAQVKDEPEFLRDNRFEADVLITSASSISPLPEAIHQLLFDSPRLKVLVLTRSGDQATLYWLDVKSRQVREVTQQTLLSDIRSMVSLS